MKNQKEIMSFVSSSINVLDIPKCDIDKIKDEYINKILQIQNYFKLKYIKTFNYFENNIILNIMRHLTFKEVTVMSQVSKKYNVLTKKQNIINSIYNLDYIWQHKFIDIYKNIRFSFDFTKQRKRLKRDAIKFRNIHKLVLPYYRNKDISFLSEVKELHLSCCYYFTDVSSLCNSTILDLTGAFGVSNQNFQTLANCSFEYLNLSGTRIMDVSNFLNVKELILNNCYYLDNLKGLQNNKILKCISICRNKKINDISMLSHVEIIDIRFCENITKHHIQTFKSNFKGTLLY